ncbi:hypothetical protein JHK84_028045 [Glycine max]|nr:hypothetical protein JHK86_027935 [Glycine max]KAG5151573.1 hypothetical protein JHK84_028045 [Glycine max]
MAGIFSLKEKNSWEVMSDQKEMNPNRVVNWPFRTLAIPAPCPQVAEDEFLPQHIDLRRFRLHARNLLRTSFYHSTLTSGAIPAPCPQVAEDEFLPQHIDLRRFRLHARKLLRTSFYRSTWTSGDSGSMPASC